MKHPPQEPNRVPPDRAVGVMLGVIVSIGIGAVIAYGILSWRTALLGGDPSAPAEQMQGVPAVVNAMETLPFTVQAQGPESHAVAESWLSGYGWIDRGRRIVHVPIGVAFDMYLSRPSPRPAGRGGAP